MKNATKNSVVVDIRHVRQMVRAGGPEAMRRWAAPSATEIKQLRSGLGLSQAQFCARYGLDVRSLQQWEQEVHAPEQVTCMLLAMIKEDADVVAGLVARARAREPELA